MKRRLLFPKTAAALDAMEHKYGADVRRRAAVAETVQLLERGGVMG